MSGSPPIADWHEFERIRVSTRHVENVTELLLRYTRAEMTLGQLAASIRSLCEEFSNASTPRTASRRGVTALAHRITPSVETAEEGTAARARRVLLSHEPRELKRPAECGAGVTTLRRPRSP